MTKWICSVGVLVLLGMSAVAQGQDVTASSNPAQSPEQGDKAERVWRQVTQQMEQGGMVLGEAILTATDHVGGQAISARVLSRERRDGQDSRREAARRPGYAIEVLCRTDDGKFKVVTIDGRSGNVVGIARAEVRRGRAGQPRLAATTRKAEGGRAAARRAGAALRVIRFSALEDSTIRNRAGEELGRLADLAVDPADGVVRYVAVSFGGWLGLGDQLVAVPLQAMELSSAERVILDVTKQALEHAEGFRQEDWPARPASRWARRGTHELAAAEEKAAEKTSEVTSIERMTELRGMTVKNRAGEELGSISELYVDPDGGRLAYAVLSHGGWLGVGDKRFAVPWSAFEQLRDDELVLDITRHRLKAAPGAVDADETVWTDPNWVLRVYEFFQVNPYWKAEDHAGPRGAADRERETE